GPFAEDAERELFSAYGIEAIVAKNSGGPAAYAKIAAARALGLPVILVHRPEKSRADAATVDEAFKAILHIAGLPVARGE
ncbi:MAG: precorrin-6A/cobalt-precorrin-6A reductase, partial [Pseudomonadota bacterium]